MNIDESLAVLRADPRLAPLLDKYGAPDLQRGTNIFRAIVRAIVYQQLSGKAASTILARFLALFGEKHFPTPAEVLEISIERLRSAGLSAQKAIYIRDAAEKFSNGSIQHRRFSKMTSDEIIEHLIQIKGVGEWTVHMLLIFTLNRPDILPIGDLGIRKGFQIVYKLKKLPTPKRMEQLAKPWRAHASVASWYLWRVADGAKNKK